MAVVRIAHISDLHLSAEHRRSHIRRTRRLLEHLVSSRFDHVVVTGDIAADGDPRDFLIARNLFSSFGLLDSSRLTVIPGNHDVYGGVHRAEDLMTFPNRCKQANVEGKLELFHRSFRETFERCLLPEGDGPYPFAKVIGGVALVGVNTVMPWSRVKNPFGSNGRVGDGQMGRLHELLASPLLCDKRKLVLIHHHFHKLPAAPGGSMHGVWSAVERRTMKLRGKKELLKLFSRTGVEMVMHGHVHEVGMTEREGIRFLNGGGSVIGADPDALAYHEVVVDGGGVRVETHTLDGVAPRERRGRPVAVQAAA
jgi:3',5'-cyclic AMP phosphodiesterase CpdA